jgi:cobyrinic acid a,c-diamide synthase
MMKQESTKTETAEIIMNREYMKVGHLDSTEVNCNLTDREGQDARAQNYHNSELQIQITNTQISRSTYRLNHK